MPHNPNLRYTLWALASSLTLLSLFFISSPIPTFHTLIKLLLLLAIFSTPLILHEIGHILVFLRTGIPLHSITLGIGPKLASLHRNPSQHPFEINIRLLPFSGQVVPNPSHWNQAHPNVRILSSIAGPAINLWAALLLTLLSNNFPPQSFSATTLNLLTHTHLSFAVLNSLPIPPLDGFMALNEWSLLKSNQPLLSVPSYQKFLSALQLTLFALLSTLLLSAILRISHWLH